MSADYFWVGGSGQWGDPAHWSTVSGGQPDNSIPDASDHVHFDQNSFSAGANSQVSIPDDAECGSLDALQVPGILSFIGNSNSVLTVYGDLLVPANVKFDFPGELLLNSTGTNNSIGIKSATRPSLVIQSGGWSLQEELTLENDANLDLRGGQFMTNDYDLKAGGIVTSDQAQVDFNVGSSDISVANQWHIADNTIFTDLGCEIVFTADMAPGDIYKGAARGANYRASTFCVNPIDNNDTIYLDWVITSDYNGSDISCNGACDGELEVTASSTGGGPFTYSFQSGPFTTQTVYSNLCAGTFSITVLDSSIQISAGNYFTCGVSDALTDPAIVELQNSIPIADPSCPDTCDGEYAVTAQGGTGFSYTFNWSNGETGSNPTQLCTGFNSVTITDANGCSRLDSVLIEDPPPLVPNVSTIGVSCFSVCDGVADSDPFGGNGPPFTYSWSTGDTQDSIGGLCAGNYDLRIFDVDGCPKDTTVTITTPLQIQINLVGTTDLLCNGVCIGEIEVAVSDGTTPYSYQWFDSGGVPIVGQTDSLATGLCAGDYYVEVTDANGCQETSPMYTITQPTVLSSSVNSTDVLCFGDCNGTASASANGGTPGYTFEYFDILDNSQGAGANINGLCPGDYYVVATDANACEDTSFFTINEPAEITTTTGQVDVLCNGFCTGEIGVVPVGGVGGNTFDWYSTPPDAVIPGENNDTIQGLCAGDYFAVVTDANGCDDTTAIVTITEPLPISISTSVTDIQCNGDCDGVIDADISGGVPAYSYQWYDCNSGMPIAGETDTIIVDLCPGSYYIEVTDANSCVVDNSASCDVITDPPQLNINITNTTDASCGGFCDGGASASTSGGSGNVTVTWHSSIDDSQQGTGTSINTLCVGTYYAVATDDNGCTDTTAVFPINDVANVTGTVNVYDASCFGVCDGAAAINASGGTTPYTYDWVRLSDGANIGVSDSVSALCAGDYTVQVFDVNGCSSPAYQFTIIENPQIFVTVNVNDASCYGDCDGSVIVNASGGSGGFTYLWTPAPGAGQGTGSPTQMCAGSYQLHVEDVAGCPFDTTITINEPAPIDVSISSTDETCAGDCDGTASVTINSGGTGPFTYNWVPAPGAGQGTPNASAMCPGTYDVTVTDANGCDTTVQVTINPAVALTVNASVISQNICPGGCTGSASAVINGGTPPYSITWSPAPGGGQGTTTATGLCAGNYTISVSDANSCPASDNVTITDPPPFDIDTSSVNNVCSGDCNGSATVTVNSGGTPPYNYLWDDLFNQTTPTAVGLCAGNYQVTVTDLNGCDTTLLFIITEPPAITATVTSSNSSCFGACNGQINLNISGGVPGYSVSWFNSTTGNPIPGGGPSITNLCPGDYHAEITDANGCMITSPVVTITEENQINLSATTVPATCPNCDGQASITATGGSGTFVGYDWTPAPGVGQGTPNGSSMCTGVYEIIVTDDIGCSDTINVAISDFPIDSIDVTPTDASCFGGCDGQANGVVTCTDPPCSLEWFNLTTGGSEGTSNPVTGLCAGDYFAQVVNVSGCVTIEQFTINEPTPIDANPSFTNPSCNSGSDGTASVSPTGGAGSYTYTWSPNPPGGQGTNTATGLISGNWSVTITDVNGCDTTVSVTLSDPPVLDVSNITSSQITCNGDADGSVTVFPTGGVPGYSYEWFECASGNPIGQTTQQATGLGPGQYYVVVTDASGCAQQSACDTVTEPAPLAGVLSSSDVICNGDCTGEGYVVASGGNMNYQYQWLDDFMNPIPGETNDTITGLCPGIYHVQLSDLNGCAVTESSITITEPTVFDVSINSTDVDCFGACNGTASATVNSGGTPPYSFNWSPAPGSGQGTPSASGMCAGTYDLTITDGAGCDTIIQVTINEPQQLLFNVVITDIVCNGDCNGDIQSSVTGGTPPYTYSWNTGATTPGISGLCDGSYTINILDANGCQADTTINLNEPTVITASTGSNDASCGQCNGSASVSPSGGHGSPYSYNWSPPPGGGQGTQNATNLCAGVYTVDVTDAGGCQVQFTIPVSNVGAETLSTDSTDAQCFDICDGTATVNFVCNDAPCQIEWYDAATGQPIGQTTGTATGLCGGDYYAEVTNNSGCISIDPVTVVAPTEILANDTITPVSCAGQTDGEITVIPTGGAGGYIYSWSPVPPNGDGTPTATGLGAGTIDLTITDADGCDSTFTFTIPNPTNMTVTTSVTDVLCNGDCNGIIDASVSGGQIPYTYQWQDATQTDIPGETNNMIINQCAGDFYLVVTDANGCSFTEGPITINEPTALSATISGVDALCNGQCDGEASVSVSGGNAPYSVTWFDSSTGNPIGQSGMTATGLCAGDYFAVISDANNCTFTTNDQTITEPSLLTATTSSTDALCNGGCDGTASVTANGGTPAYLYEWLDAGGAPVSGGGNPNVSNLCAGSYTVEVTDANGCSVGPLTVDIFAPTQITGSIFVNDANCGISDGSATVTAAGGTPGYSYQWFDDQMTTLAGEINPTLSNIPAGTFYVEVTDAAGCTETFQANVGNINGAIITIDSITDVSCNGSCDGDINVTVTGTNPPFTYAWNPGGLTQPDISGLCAGTYTLQVTDALGCISFNDTTISENPALDATFATTDATCGLCDGDATVTASGGAGGYTYDWTTGSTSPAISNLCPGTYSVQISDADGCQETFAVGITNTGGPTGENISVTGPSCQGYCDADVTVTPIGGTPPYTYFWTHDGSTTNTITGLCAGTYFLQVTDSLGCIRTVQVDIMDPAGLTDNSNTTPATCGLCDGQITASISGGATPYSYQWSHGSTTQSVNALCEGVYLLEVTDANGCIDTMSYNVNGDNAPQVVLTPTDATCGTVCDGSISSDTTGGTQPMTYQWLDDQGAPIAGETNSSITGLCAGTYMLEVTDAAGCISSSQASIDAPDAFQFSLPFVFDASCNGVCDGEANTMVIGGTLPYTYDWIPDPGAGDGTSQATAMCAGAYDVEVTDGNGCIDTQQVVVNEPTAITIVVDSIQDALCLNSNDGAVWVTASGGTPGYTYDWVSDPAGYSSTDEDPDSLFAQSYILTVTDGNGCTETDTAMVDTQIVVIANAGPDTLVCPNTTVDIIGIGTGTSSLNYQWYDSTGAVVDTDSLLSVSEGVGSYTFVLEVSDASCMHTDTVTIIVAPRPLADAGPDQTLVDGESTEIGGTPTASNGTTISWTPSTWLNDTSIANPITTPDSTIYYVVNVMDPNGCVNSDTVLIEVLPFIWFPNGFSPNGDGVNDTWQIDLIQEFPESEVWVYNRWGELLFYSLGYKQEWDGTHNDKPLPVGTYYYVVKLNHPLYPEPYTGPITILR